MDETEHPADANTAGAGILAGLPVRALDLTLTRSAIRMKHSHSWSIDKVNSFHDLVICLSGQGVYLLGDQHVSLTPGMAMLIPAGTRFQGRNPDPDLLYTGLAQHFRLDLFGRHDFLARLHLRQVVTLSRWPMLEPLVRHYRATAPASSVTMSMHHAFMVILNEFIEDAFLDWRDTQDATLDQSEGLSMAVMIAAARIAAEPLQAGLAEQVVRDAPYSDVYFRREFRRRLGATPAKYQEFKRMEIGMQLLEAGKGVSETATRLGFADVYYFSRLFKRHIGTSPRGWKNQVRLRRDGHWPRGQEDGEILYPLRPPPIHSPTGAPE
ncbi:helix-turn-helix transcriptional regulator [Roseinatronobacter alkalisoli]|uniref:AraC family transcriptional regulator n=1 Tax=Roseinatronobacter alkalisoli TaxID=3028235 RepID=A0ABT5TAT8_9RHOB|nr:AraC family transcriptional regulator [Roseinatronobacter sp. HJB301]MDD7972232.1 AraC family transcriptional regulator [Roseinatronobacter sp. HJB301]